MYTFTTLYSYTHLGFGTGTQQSQAAPLAFDGPSLGPFRPLRLTETGRGNHPKKHTEI